MLHMTGNDLRPKVAGGRFRSMSGCIEITLVIAPSRLPRALDRRGLRRSLHQIQIEEGNLP